MNLFRTAEPLRRAEETLFAEGLAWWRSWQKRHGLKPPTTPLTFEHSDVPVHDVPMGKQGHVHMVSCTAPGANPKGTPLVCLHGFAHSTSCFYSSLAPLAEAWDGPVHALDMPGCGLSSRPSFSPPTDSDARRIAAEEFVISGLEGWRQAMGVETMAIAGHSIGGYVAVAYAEAHPERVERLVLVSPAGVPRPPPDLEEEQKEYPAVFRAALAMWGRGWSPIDLVRWGPGRSLCRGYVDRRIADATWGSAAAKGAYAECMYLNHVTGDGSWGASAHSTLLRPGAHARAPLCDRVPALPGWADGTLRGVAFLYGGAGDWMPAGAAEAIARQPRMAGRVEVGRVAGARHNVPQDNPLGMVEGIAAAAGRAGRVHGRVFGAAALREDAAWRAEEERATERA